MKLQLDTNTTCFHEGHRNFWSDNRIWWVNCLALERYWPYGDQDLQVARGRRDAILTALLDHL